MSPIVPGPGIQDQHLEVPLIFSKLPALYLFDEPTCGFHPIYANHLIGAFQRLVKMRNSEIVIEYKPEVILSSDWVIDLGPEGGNYGGNIIVQGTPETVINCETSATGKILKKYVRSSTNTASRLIFPAI